MTSEGDIRNAEAYLADLTARTERLFQDYHGNRNWAITPRSKEVAAALKAKEFEKVFTLLWGLTEVTFSYTDVTEILSNPNPQDSDRAPKAAVQNYRRALDAVKIRREWESLFKAVESLRPTKDVSAD